MSGLTAFVLLVGGFFAGLINAMAGGGSLITVPLLSLAGIGGTVANGTNRVAVLTQSSSSTWGYFRRGAGSLTDSLPVLVPVAIGALIGSLGASQLDDRLFERLFGALMVPLLVLSIRSPRAERAERPWPRWRSLLAFGAIGAYGGAVQVGVGLLLLLVLARVGHDLVAANAIKTLVVACITLIAVPVFAVNGQVRWLPALVLSAGMGAGGYAGANLAVDRGERVIRPVLVVVVIVLASRMLGLWDLVGS